MAKDPRRKKLKQATSLTVNERLFDDALRQATMVDRWRTGLTSRVLRLLDDKVLPGLMLEIEREAFRVMAGKKQSTRLKRLQKLGVILRSASSGRMTELRKFLKQQLVGTAKLEADFQAMSIRRASSAAALELSLPSVATLNQLVTKQPFTGGTLGQWMKGLARRTATSARQEITIGMTQGDSIEEMTRRLRARLPHELRRNLRSIVRTAVTHVSSAAREATYKANDDLIKGVRYVATLDLRTTDICASLDGRVFKVEEGPRPPLHFNCRSTTVPIVKSWEELGIPAKNLDPSTRASMNGQVPATQTYGTWIRRQPAALQDEALGRVRGRLLRQGKLEVRGLVDQRYRPLTLEQIRKKQGLSSSDIEI